MVCLGLLVSSTANAVSVIAHSWLVADHKGKIIDGENTEQVRSIASITKLITVMVVLDAQQDLKELLGPHSREDLIRLSLIKSDNKSAQILCDNYPTGRAGCIRAMNNKVHSIGLTETRFVEPTGLSVMNVSTASELVTVVLEAQHYPQIVEASQSSHVKIQVRKKWVIFKNTNPIIGKRHHFIVSKTGYINASGGCIVMMLDTDVGRRIVVVLGSKNTHTRIPEAEFIAQH